MELPSTSARAALRQRLLDWYLANRRDLPWRRITDPYAIWVSEIMLQQTQVKTVIPYFEAWLLRFPNLKSLARADQGEVLAAWSGLGYYRRAKLLHQGAKDVLEHWDGKIPEDEKSLQDISGIGRYTAGAIASIAFGRPAPIVDGNVSRVYARLFGIDSNIASTEAKRTLWKLADYLVPNKAPGDFNQGVMELGATLCTPKSPECADCPLASRCVAKRENRVSQLPVVAPRTPKLSKPELAVEAIWLERRGKLLLCRRNDAGLYQGMWELPHAPAKSKVADTLGVKLELTRRPVAEHHHELSHRRLHIRVYKAEAIGRAKLADTASFDKIAWFKISELATLALSSAMKEVIRQTMENSCQTKP